MPAFSYTTEVDIFEAVQHYGLRTKGKNDCMLSNRIAPFIAAEPNYPLPIGDTPCHEPYNAHVEGYQIVRTRPGVGPGHWPVGYNSFGDKVAIVPDFALQ